MGNKTESRAKRREVLPNFKPGGDVKSIPTPMLERAVANRSMREINAAYDFEGPAPKLKPMPRKGAVAR